MIKFQLSSFPDPIPQPAYKKLDNQGNFQTYRGLTIISAVASEQKLLWQELYECLNNIQELKKIVKLLPPESYHMTLFDLVTEEKVKQNWKTFVETQLPFMQEISETLNTHELNLSVSVEQVNLKSVLVIELKTEQEEQSMIDSLALKLDLLSHIPRHGHHLTLGYRYREGKDEDFNPIKEIVANKLNALFTKIKLSPAKLCYFNSMTHFEPWDGQKNPWS